MGGITTPQRTHYYMIGVKQRIKNGEYDIISSLEPMQKVALLYVLESIATLSLRQSGWYYCNSSDFDYELSKCGLSTKHKTVKRYIKILKDSKLIDANGVKNINYRYVMLDHDSIESYGYSIFNGNMFTKKQIDKGDDIW